MRATLSMLVDAIAIAHARPAGATESTVLGPFYVAGSPLQATGRHPRRPAHLHDPARPAGVEGPWCSVENDIALAPATRAGERRPEE